MNINRFPAMAIFLFSLLMIAIPAPALCADAAVTGSSGILQVISKTSPLRVYVDNEFQGITPVKMINIQAGSHYVSITSNTGITPEAVFFENIVIVKEGEIQTLVLPLQQASMTENGPSTVAAVFVTPKYFSENKNGWFVKVGLFDSYFYNASWSDFWRSSNKYAGSSLGFGGGYAWGLNQNISLVAEADRADFSSGQANWYIMPVSVSLRAQMPNFRGLISKHYFGLSLSYSYTNVQVNGVTITPTSYGLLYGIIFPYGAKDEFSVDLGYNFGSAQESTGFSYFSLSCGYKWN